MRGRYKDPLPRTERGGERMHTLLIWNSPHVHHFIIFFIIIANHSTGSRSRSRSRGRRRRCFASFAYGRFQFLYTRTTNGADGPYYKGDGWDKAQKQTFKVAIAFSLVDTSTISVLQFKERHTSVNHWIKSMLNLFFFALRPFLS